MPSKMLKPTVTISGDDVLIEYVGRLIDILSLK